MTQRPIVRLLREPTVARRITGRRAPPPPQVVSSDVQAGRFGERFERIAQTLATAEAGTRIADDPADIVPGRVLVFDVIGAVAKFEDAAIRLGFDWLAERDPGDDDPDFDGSDADVDPDEVGERLYLAMPSEQSLHGLVTLWRAYQAGVPAVTANRAWWQLFGYLNDLRAWSARDRIEGATVRYVHRLLAANPAARVRLELNLWFGGPAEERASDVAQVGAVVEEIGGTVLDVVRIDPIFYLGMLVDLPAVSALDIASRQGPLANAASVSSVRPQSLFATEPGQDESPEAVPLPAGEPSSRPPLACLLDGHIVDGHSLLRGLVQVLEVDVSGAAVPVASREHGTAMASMILHGDLAVMGGTASRTLKAIPILGAAASGLGETTPLDKLPIGLVYRAIASLKEGLDGSPATGTDIVIINHSICDISSPFSRRPSAWAKLLDYLSHRYGLLFVVSAGNRHEAVDLPDYEDEAAFTAADPYERQNALILALERDKEHRRIFSPAEAMNVLTVGGLHEDGSGQCPPNHIDPFLAPGLTNIGSALGPGIGRSIKPDLVEEGGRQVAGFVPSTGSFGVWARQIHQTGHAVAAPDRFTGALDRIRRITGTSNAAALMTRAAVRTADAVEDVFAADGLDWLSLPTKGVILRALLVHGCTWGDIGPILDAAYPPPGPMRWHGRRETIARVLGYGRADMGRVLSGETNRITLLAQDGISDEQRHEYRIPIPASLVGSREVRRIALTLAWSTPIRPGSLGYRGVGLQLTDGNGKRSFWDKVEATLQPNADTQRRGTVIHTVLEGQGLVRSIPTEGMVIGVQARAPDDQMKGEIVPYALAVSVEVGTGIRSDVYAEIKARARLPVAQRTPARIRSR